MFLSPEYIFILIFIVFYLVFLSKKKWPFYFIMAYMTFLGVFRGLEVGTDHAGYEADFYILNSYEDINHIFHRFEIGYISLILLFKNFSNDYLLFSGLTFLLPMIGTAIFIEKYKINRAWALFVFFTLGMYFDAMNLMRQYMAICSIAAFTYLLKRQEYKKFAFVCFLVSIAFHLSSILMLLLIPIFYYFEQKKYLLSKKILYLLIIGSYLLFFVGPKTLAPVLLAAMNILPFDDFSGYISNFDDAEISNAMVSVYTFYALLLVYFNKNAKYQAELMCFVFFIITFNILNMFSTFAFRAALPFKYYMIALIPLLISDNKTFSKRIIKLVTIVFMLAVFYVSYVLSNMNHINPYDTWL